MVYWIRNKENQIATNHWCYRDFIELWLDLKILVARSKLQKYNSFSFVFKMVSNCFKANLPKWTWNLNVEYFLSISISVAQKLYNGNPLHSVSTLASLRPTKHKEILIRPPILVELLKNYSNATASEIRSFSLTKLIILIIILELLISKKRFFFSPTIRTTIPTLLHTQQLICLEVEDFTEVSVL